jgi:hypothetical protein
MERPEEWSGIPREEHSKPGVLKAQLDWIVEQGGAGRPFLLRHVPVSERHRLQKCAHNYRRDYGRYGFRFEVRQLPSNVQQAVEIRETHGEDAVGLFTVWRQGRDGAHQCIDASRVERCSYQ